MTATVRAHLHRWRDTEAVKHFPQLRRDGYSHIRSGYSPIRVCRSDRGPEARRKLATVSIASRP